MVEKQGSHEEYVDDSDIDDDPFDVGKISDSGSSDDVVSDSLDSESDLSEIIGNISQKKMEFCHHHDRFTSLSTQETFKQDKLTSKDLLMNQDGPQDLHLVPEDKLNPVGSEDGISIFKENLVSAPSHMESDSWQESVIYQNAKGQESSQVKDRSHIDDHLPQAKKKRKIRPSRYCVFCKKTVEGGKLKRHIKTHKHSHEEVHAILKQPKQVQDKFFEKKRIEGMYEYNMANLEDSHKIMRERKPKKKDQVRLCSKCQRFYSNRTFYRHRSRCTGISSDCSDPLKVDLIKPNCMEFPEDNDFTNNILNRFRDSDVGKFIRSNKIVQIIGYTRYCARRVESSKINEVRKEIMTEMRELTRLFFHFRNISPIDVAIEDMYKRKHINNLKMAMNTMCEGTEEGAEKHGLKLNIHATFQKSLKIFKGYLSESMRDDDMDEIGRFQDAFQFSSAQLLAKARYETEKNSMHKARLPKNLPEERDMKTLKNFITGQLVGLVNDFDLTQYTWLRSLVVARLTLYNGRRGEEPSRMLMQEWFDALAEKWVPQNQVEAVEDEAEKYLYGQYKLVYLHGKGKKYVPVLVPKDLIHPIQILIENRKGFNITEDNMFLFGTKSSNAHCSGWHAVNEICAAAGVTVNATRNRHRLSSIYASLDMSDGDRQIFMDHLGHGEDINRDNYQCPPGMKVVRVMGKFLEAADSGTAAVEDHSSTSPTGISPSSSETVQTDMNIERVEDQAIIAVEDQAIIETFKKAGKQKTGSFRWAKEATVKIKQDFRKWIELPTGNKLPGKKDLEDYLKRNHLGCTLQQLRTKIMNEQNKRQNIVARKLKELQEC